KLLSPMEQDLIDLPLKDTPHLNGADESPLDHQELLRVLSLVKNGKLDTRMPVTQAGISGRICEVLNDIIDMNERLVAEISSAEVTIGKKGNLLKRIELPDAKGQCANGVASLTILISELHLDTLDIAGII